MSKTESLTWRLYVGAKANKWIDQITLDSGKCFRRLSCPWYHSRNLLLLVSSTLHQSLSASRLTPVSPSVSHTVTWVAALKCSSDLISLHLLIAEKVKSPNIGHKVHSDLVLTCSPASLSSPCSPPATSGDSGLLARSQMCHAVSCLLFFFYCGKKTQCKIYPLNTFFSVQHSIIKYEHSRSLELVHLAWLKLYTHILCLLKGTWFSPLPGMYLFTLQDALKHSSLWSHPWCLSPFHTISLLCACHCHIAQGVLAEVYILSV